LAFLVGWPGYDSGTMTDRVLHPEQVRALRKMSLGERLLLNARLWDNAHALKAAAFRARHPDWSEEQIRQAAREAIRRADRCDGSGSRRVGRE
jgi:hypothetical protein